jgi:hypothetical protein
MEVTLPTPAGATGAGPWRAEHAGRSVDITDLPGRIAAVDLVGERPRPLAAERESMAMGTTAVRLTKPFRRVVSAIAVSGFVASAEPASAYEQVGLLRVHDKFCITATGYIPMGQYETHGYLNNGTRLKMWMYGDDSVYDDDLGSSSWVTKDSGTVKGARLYPSERGIEFEWKTCGPGSFWLNEDLGDDEVYVYVLIVDGDGGLLLGGQTNVVTGDYAF